MVTHHDPTDCPASRMTWLLDRLAVLLRSMPPDRQEELTSTLSNGNLEPIDLHAKEETNPPPESEASRPGWCDRRRRQP